jgi:hypothetical protein
MDVYVTQDSSNVNPLALLFLVVMSLVVLRGQRSAAVNALLAVAAFMPLGQQVVVFGLHIQFFRILTVVGFLRIMSRGENSGFTWTRIDKLFVAWALTAAVCGALRAPGSIMGINCLGGAFNEFGTYFLIRILTKDPIEAVDHLRLLALATIFMAMAMSWEYVVHKNLFAVFGGVPFEVLVRDGRFRCQGPFRHPILAGTFAATLFPLLAGMWLRGRRDKLIAFLGMAACGFISTVAAASSGAMLTCITAVLGLALWPIRARMQIVRRLMVLAIIGLTVTMRSPPWYLIAKASDVFGGTGWHRAFLIDQAVKYFGEWCLIGTSVTAHWAPAGQVLPLDPNNMDITNHYVMQGVQGGILGLGLFITIIVNCFKVVGRTLRRRKDSPLGSKMLWAFGVGLACHCVAFVSISYFDQIEVFWFWLLAIFATIAASDSQRAPTERSKNAPARQTLAAQREQIQAHFLRRGEQFSAVALGSGSI